MQNKLTIEKIYTVLGNGTQAVSAIHNDSLVERVVAVFDNETEELKAEHTLRSFDLEKFKQRFGVEENADPLMFNVYPVSPSDANFVLEYLDEPIAFDFGANAYFIECFSVE